MFDKRILPYSTRGGIQMFREALAPAGTYAPSFKYIFLINLALGALCTAAWCSGSGSVPSEIAEPTRGSVVRMRIYQSIAKQRLFRNPTDLRQFFCHSSRIFNTLAGKMPLQATGHKKYYGRISILDMGSLS